MERDDLWRAIDDQRIRLADVLATLTDEEWRTRSLCPEWTVREVAGHLTMQQTGVAELGPLLVDLVRAGGRLDRAIAAAAVRRAGRPTGELIAAIRAMVGSRRHNVGVTERETLIDILVHSQDIVVPLGRTLALDPAAAAEAARRVWTIRYFRAARRLRGFQLRATDADLVLGQGEPVHGPVTALLLALTGRTVALSELDGTGAAALRRRLDPVPGRPRGAAS